MKVGRLGAEHIFADTGLIGDFNREAARWASGPDTTMLLAEGAAALSGRDLARLGLPIEFEVDVATVAGTVNEHDGPLELIMYPLSGFDSRCPEWLTEG